MNILYTHQKQTLLNTSHCTVLSIEGSTINTVLFMYLFLKCIVSNYILNK